MIQVIPYTFKNKTDVIRENIVSGIIDIVCPGPQVADGLRQQLQREIDSSDALNLNVITFSKFLKDLLTTLGKNIELKRKSDLLLTMSSVWRQMVPEGTYSAFVTSFDLFTELRGFSTELSVVEDALEHIDDITKRLVMSYYKIMEMLEYVDEYKACSIVSSKYQQSEQIKKKYLMYGFSFMTGVQIDMLKTLGQYDDVIVLVPLNVLREIKQVDWISWLGVIDDSSFKDTQLENVVDAQVAYCSKGRTGEALERVIAKIDASDKRKCFIACEKKMHKEFPLSVIGRGLLFKSEIVTFEVIVDSEFTRFKNEVISQHPVRDKELEPFSIEVCLKVVRQIIKEEISSNFGTANTMKIKVLLLMYERFESWANSSDKNVNLTEFDLEVFQHIVSLDTPRIFLVAVEKDNMGIVGGFDVIPYTTNDDVVILVANSYTGDLVKSVDRYNHGVETVLSSVGPIKRSRIEYLFAKAEVLEVLDRKNSILVMEEGIDEIFPGWKEVLEELNLKSVEVDQSGVFLESLSFLNNIIASDSSVEERASITAGKLQSYMDCPRKFYFTYQNQVDQRVKSKKALLPYHLGEIQHLSIKAWFENKSNEISVVVREVFFAYLKQHEVELGSFDILKELGRLKVSVENGVNVLNKLLHDYSMDSIQFEVAINVSANEKKMVGRIDAILSNDKEMVIIDFKRSASGVPNKSDFLDFQAVQLWFYLARLKSLEASKKVKMIMYLNLDSVEDSLCITNEMVNIDAMADLYIEKENNIVSTMCADKKFLPTPASVDVCNYCPVKGLCERD